MRIRIRGQTLHEGANRKGGRTNVIKIWGNFGMFTSGRKLIRTATLNVKFVSDLAIYSK